MRPALLLCILWAFIPSIVAAQDQSSGFSHDFELAGSDTAFTLAGAKVIDAFPGGHDFWFMAPVFNVAADLMYRIPEFQGTDGGHYAHEFLTLDLPGIAVGCLFEVLFPPSKKN
jgi:hypothetical protein